MLIRALFRNGDGMPSCLGWCMEVAIFIAPDIVEEVGGGVRLTFIGTGGKVPFSKPAIENQDTKFEGEVQWYLGGVKASANRMENFVNQGILTVGEVLAAEIEADGEKYTASVGVY